MIYKILSQINIDPMELRVPMPDNPGDRDGLLARILPIVFGIAGSIAALIIVIAGIIFILSRGDPQKSATARNAIIYASIGLAISLAAFGIVSIVVGSV